MTWRRQTLPLLLLLLGLAGPGWAQSTVSMHPNTASFLRTRGSDTATLGAELVTNGTFASDLTGWAGANWAFNAGKALHTAGVATALSQNVSVTTGSTYQVTITTSGRTAGSVTLAVGAVAMVDTGATTAISSNAAYTRTLVAGATGAVALTITPTADFDGAVDDISVKVLSAYAGQAAILYDGTGAEYARLRGSYVLNNTGYGFRVFQSLMTGIKNTAFGIDALFSVTTGSWNTGIGDAPCAYTTVGSANTCIGHDAVYYNTTGSRNVGVGHNTLMGQSGLSTGYDNTGVGTEALKVYTTGYRNVAVGDSALVSLTTGALNTAVGFQAGRAITTGLYNVAIGDDALRAATTQSYSTAFGAEALLSATANNNTAIGFQAGAQSGATPAYTNAVTTGSKLTFLGSQAGLGSASQRTNATAIGAEAYVDADNTVVLGDENVTNIKIGSAAQASADLKTITFTATTYAALGTPANGTVVYCSDCTFANPCAGSGTGAIAKRLNGAWRCD